MYRWVGVLALASCDKFISLDRYELPDASPVGHNEDNDGFADTDDNCPANVNNNQADRDKDSVGDACDPNPDVGNDRIAAFYTFETKDEPRWVRVAGNWSFVEDQLVYSSTSATDQSMYAKNAPEISPPYVVEAHLILDEMNTVSAIDITANLDTVPEGASCGLVRNFQDRSFVTVYTPGSSDQTEVTAISPAEGYRARLTVDSNMLCDVRGDVVGKGGSIAAVFTTPRAGYVGFEGRNVRVRVDYMIVYAKQ